MKKRLSKGDFLRVCETPRRKGEERKENSRLFLGSRRPQTFRGGFPVSCEGFVQDVTVASPVKSDGRVRQSTSGIGGSNVREHRRLRRETVRI